jgi:hypothetical protein
VLFGIACTARLTVVFGAPFFMLVGGGGSWARRSISAGIGAAIPVGILLLYNLGTTGHAVHPGYDYQYQIEARGYQLLGYNPTGRSRTSATCRRTSGSCSSRRRRSCRCTSSGPSARPRTGVHRSGGDPRAVRPALSNRHAADDRL